MNTNSIVKHHFFWVCFPHTLVWWSIYSHSKAVSRTSCYLGRLTVKRKKKPLGWIYASVFLSGFFSSLHWGGLQRTREKKQQKTYRRPQLQIFDFCFPKKVYWWAYVSDSLGIRKKKKSNAFTITVHFIWS